MSSGVRKALSGAFNGTGAQIDITTVGFRPRTVELFNVSGLCTARWQDSMADGSMLKNCDTGSGTEDMTFVTGGAGITPLANGFRLGADADLNVAAEVVHWEASE